MATNLIVQAIISTSPKYEDRGQLSKILRQYTEAIWPEQELETERFDKEGRKLMTKFMDKIITLNQRSGEISGSIVTKEHLLAEIEAKKKEKENADT